MTKTNKILLGSLATLAVAAPLATTVSCGSKSEKASLESDVKKIANENWSSQNIDDDISTAVAPSFIAFINDKLLSTNKNIDKTEITKAMENNFLSNVKEVKEKEEAKNDGVNLTAGKQYSITVKTKEKKDQTKIYDFNGKEVAMPVLNIDIKTNKILKADDMSETNALKEIKSSINGMYEKIDLKMKITDFRNLVYKNLTDKINDFYKTNLSQLEVSKILHLITFQNGDTIMSNLNQEFAKIDSEKTLSNVETGDVQLKNLKTLKINFIIATNKKIGQYKVANDIKVLDYAFFKK